MSLAVGQVLDGKYRIVRLLGEGAMGAVFEGENTRIKRRVAIKVLHAAVAARKDLVDRFEREAQAAGRIGSEHIVEVLDLGELPDGSRYLVMEFLDGQSLSSRIEQYGRLLPAQALPMIRQLLVGLAAAHQAGIVHRDLKPDNIFLLKERAGQRDFVKIVDFGVSKFSPLNGEEAKMTQTGAVMGTPYYMSPEQAKGAKDIDHRSDLFSVGVILYEAVTGRVPFDGETFNELMFKIALQDPPPPESIVPGLDAGIGRLIRRALARDPAQRFANATDFVGAIDEWLSSGTSTVDVPDPSQVALAPASVAIPTQQSGATVLFSASQAPAGQQSFAGATQAEWSQSQPNGVPQKSKAPLLIGLALGVGTIAGVALFALSGKSGVDSPTPAASVSGASTSKSETSATPTTTDPANSPPATASATTTSSSLPVASNSAASNTAPPNTAASSTAAATGGAATTARLPATKSTATAKTEPPAPATAAATAAPPTATATATGRRVREF
jgi:serine/threonine protein kinase